MKKSIVILTLFMLITAAVVSIVLYYVDTEEKPKEELIIKTDYYPKSKPFTRWWWFASKIKKEDVKNQLDWLRKNNFGGVEIAWVYPLNRNQRDTVNYTPRYKWLGKEWAEIVEYTKKYADSIGLGCDFTFGTLWPFGDIYVPEEDASRVWGDDEWRQKITASWDYPKEGYVINHLDSNAFFRYAERMGNALKPAFDGSKSAIFCDSWEVETQKIWTPGFGNEFEKRFGYDLEQYMDSIYQDGYEGPRYDYFKLISEYVIEQFYKPFTQKAHELGGFSRSQCSGAPCDLITAYSVIDVPETEAMLYEPNFSKIVASSAALSSKVNVSSETFTCLYGWPREHIQEEQTADLKLVADALFANGVNQIIWHGTPFNPADTDTVCFYATVHVGKKGSLTEELPAFNNYMTKLSEYMKKGVTYSDVAVYLPLEDSWVAGYYPPERQMRWSWGQYELRYVHFPDELSGYHPLWINHDFLKKARVDDGIMYIGELEFSLLYIDVDHVDIEAMETILSLAKKGVAICLKQTPQQPGKIKSSRYYEILEKLEQLPNVSDELTHVVKNPPLVSFVSGDQSDFWCRRDAEDHYIFFAHPLAYNLEYPMAYGQSQTNDTIEKIVRINTGRKVFKLNLKFEPYQSLLYKITNEGIEEIDIRFVPKEPVKR
jgi:hypothetical protein